MLKTGSKILLILVSSLLFWGCGKDKSDSNSGTSTACLQNPYTGTCDNSAYNQYAQWGFYPYPINANNPGYTSDPNSPFRYRLDYYYYGYYGNSTNLCNCPAGTRPVYNGGMGIGCAAVQAMPNWLPIYYHGLNTISGPPINNHYVNIPQVSNITGVYNNFGGCYGQVAWSCLLNQPNQCPSGTACQANAQNSPIGICVKQ